jgi:hypothetical protein
MGVVVKGTDGEVYEEGERVSLPLRAPVQVEAEVVLLDETVTDWFEPRRRDILEDLGVSLFQGTSQHFYTTLHNTPLHNTFL